MPRRLVLAVTLAACSPTAPPVARAAPPAAVTAPAAPTPAAPPAAVTLPSAPVPATPAPPAPVAPEPAPVAASFHREVEGAVTSIALEHPPFAAALGPDTVWMHEPRGWHGERLPAGAHAGPGVTRALFYGRDDRVRLVGTRRSGDAATGIYLRWLPRGWDRARAEIGKLAALDGVLVAVLGTADPEIVCQPTSVCLIKRRSGWTIFPAPADVVQVTLGEGTGWGVAGQKLLRLDGHWAPAGPPGSWASADALFALRDRAWVVETAAGRLHAFDGARWTVTPAPIEGPRALWGARADALWLAGDGGLAFWDGAAWHRVPGAPAPLAAVLGRDADDVWIGGAAGLYRVERAPAAR
jgi:hypothetical protein